MQRYVIERSIPGAGTLSGQELHDISAKSNEILASMAPRAQWSRSYVTDGNSVGSPSGPKRSSTRRGVTSSPLSTS